MHSGESFGGSDYSSEVPHDPEVTELLEFLGAYQKVQKLISWLVEASVSADPMLVGVRRKHLQRLMQQLGLDPESPDAFSQLEGIKSGLTDRTHNPKPRLDVPEVGFFKSRIKEIVSEQQRFGAPQAYDFASDGIATVRDVAVYGHTDWRSVQSRSGESHYIGKWIHGVAQIMADPVAYHAEFAGLGINGAHRAADHLTIGEDWSIQNGRHRSLAVRSLGEDFVAEAGMAQWVKVAVEQP